MSLSSYENDKGKQISPLIHTQVNANLTSRRHLRKESTKEIAFLRPDQLESPAKYLFARTQLNFNRISFAVGIKMARPRSNSRYQFQATELWRHYNDTSSVLVINLRGTTTFVDIVVPMPLLFDGINDFYVVTVGINVQRNAVVSWLNHGFW